MGSAALGIAALVGWKVLDMGDSGRGEPAQPAAASDAQPDGPERCAALRDISGNEAKAQPIPGGPTVRTRGTELWLEQDSRAPGGSGTLTLGIVADARDTVEHLAAVHRAFAEHEVSLVVSLGGMATTEIKETLAELAGPWPVLAIPGDRESMSAHRAACQALAGQGIVDGSQIRRVRAGSIVMATFPGAPHVRRLVAGAAGCVHTAEDADALKSLYEPEETTPEMDEKPAIRVLLSHAPPGQPGTTGTDRAAGGVSVGEPWLFAALSAAGVDLAIHGLITPAGAAARGRADLGDNAVVLAAGAADGLADAAQLLAGDQTRGARPPLGLIVSIDAQNRAVRWHYIGSHP